MTESSTEGIRQEVGERLERDSGRDLVLIVDDAKINREILFEMLKDRFDIIEASSGEECLELLHQYGTEISIVLLDFIMSGMDGLGVLKVMNKEHLIEDIPVIMISSEDSELHIRQAYEMGVSDYISRPFDTSVVLQRVYNTIKLYAKQRKLIDLVAGQMQEKEKNNQIMVNILSHIVAMPKRRERTACPEYRNTDEDSFEKADAENGSIPDDMGRLKPDRTGVGTS